MPLVERALVEDLDMLSLQPLAEGILDRLRPIRNSHHLNPPTKSLLVGKNRSSVEDLPNSRDSLRLGVVA
jgi:hypothetical protein